jgi:hypothetical protein
MDSPASVDEGSEGMSSLQEETNSGWENIGWKLQSFLQQTRDSEAYRDLTWRSEVGFRFAHELDATPKKYAFCYLCFEYVTTWPVISLLSIETYM